MPLFFPRHPANTTVACYGGGVGWKGHSCPTLGLLHPAPPRSQSWASHTGPPPPHTPTRTQLPHTGPPPPRTPTRTQLPHTGPPPPCTPTLTQLPHTGPSPSPHPHAHSQHKAAGGCSHSPLRLSNPKFTQAQVQGPESCPSTTPRNTIFGACWNLSYAGCNRLLGCLILIFKSCTVFWVVFFPHVSFYVS